MKQTRRVKGGRFVKTACVDIGGTYLKAGLLADGALTDVTETPSRAEEGAAALLDRVAALVRAMPGVQRVGISTAGEVDAAGTIRLSDNIPGYTGMAVKARLQAALDLPVAVLNDVNAAALGEYAFGAAKGTGNFLMVSYGTGVGGAAVVDGRLYTGAGGSAGEFGGMLTHPEALDPADRGSGSYERYASTAALVARARQLDSALASGRAVFARLDEPAVAALVEAWTREVAVGLVGLIHAFDPAAVVLGGGIFREEFLRRRVPQLVAPLLKPSFAGCRLVGAALGNNAGLLGAGWLAQQG